MEEPKTIEELKQWYVAHNLPNENITRFFIGTNYKMPKAFGIYQDETTGQFIVYKNKADGSRSIRYQGNDEAYAVRELYLKLKQEIGNQKQRIMYNSKKRRSITVGEILVPVMIILFFVTIIVIEIRKPYRGYYTYGNHYYYYQGYSWYEYDDYYGWDRTSVPDELKANYANYYDSEDYYYSYGIDSFENSRYYREPSSSSDDDDYTWDSSDSWDSSYTDWDSDW